MSLPKTQLSRILLALAWTGLKFLKRLSDFYRCVSFSRMSTLCRLILSHHDKRSLQSGEMTVRLHTQACDVDKRHFVLF